MLFKYQGHISAALILGGVDFSGPSLYTIHPHGSTDKLPFVTMGSGSLAAMGVFEAGYKVDMTRDEAIQLTIEAVSAGIFQDLGSGSNIDLTVLEKGKVDVLRNFVKPNERLIVPKLQTYRFPYGTTPVLKSNILPLHDLASIENMSIELK